ncbi:hypothetical protein DFR70_12640 [Nocardia tenerifensis]|uniref:Uncharacterized protein n=1 Tax=Nocardia tenerifensis TaxID=228006 RepID=A0A318JL07_9NOCA|nr:hypothetical protein [Nocardia tenerifensis]PXX53919.1 hypothetical protein DFR70_12640 [Nocardia tenerifensis]
MIEVDRVQVVQEMWPSIGPHDVRSLSAAAAATREILRTLAHATVVRADALKALPYVVDGYTMLGGLAEAASSERQFLQQLADWAEHFADDPTLRHTEHRDQPGEGIAQAQQSALETAEDLREAAGHAEALMRALQRAQAHTSPLYHDDEKA